MRAPWPAGRRERGIGGGGRSRRQHSAFGRTCAWDLHDKLCEALKRGPGCPPPPCERRLHAAAKLRASAAAAPATAGEMSAFCMPMLIINMGGEMVYILEQRLHAQNVPMDKSKRGAH